MLHAAIFTALWGAALPVQVVSDGCPPAAEVEAALVKLLPPVADGKGPDVARLLRLGNTLQLQLLDPQGAIVGERLLDHRGSCSDLASLAAVVIASLESDVHPAFSRPESHLPTRPSVRLPDVDRAMSRPAGKRSYDVSATAGFSYAESAAVTGTLAAMFVPRSSGPGVRMSATGETYRTLDLGPDRARWRRWIGSVEVGWRFLRGNGTLDVHGGALVGWLTATGDTFTKNQSAWSFSPGLTVGARLAIWANRRYAIGFDVAAWYAGRDQSLTTAPGGATVDVPRFQALAGLTVAVGRLR